MKQKVVEAIEYGKSSNRLEDNEPTVQETEMILQEVENTTSEQFVSHVVKLVKVPEGQKEKEGLHG